MSKAHVLKVYGREPETFDELAECVIAVANTYRTRRIDRKGKLTEGPLAKVVGLSWDITYSPQVSTSHSSPMCGANKTGFAPGMLGRVWIRYDSSDSHSFGSDPLRQSLTYTGTGGAGGYSGPFERVMNARYKCYGHQQRYEDTYPSIAAYSWDYRIYLSDWPKLEEMILAQVTWHTLQDKHFSFKHHYLWQDPDTAAMDEQFIKLGKDWHREIS